jgi:acetyl-CoA C-acetyltransferase
MGQQSVEDSIFIDGLTDAFHQYPMGITAENIAESLNISRKEQDEFALASQVKACTALDNHGFKDEIESVTVSHRRKQVTVETDEYPKRDASADSIAALRPAFKKEGTVTAGNSSGINDGAAALILASKSAVQRHNLQPMAEIISYGQAGLSPEIMGLGPVPAIANALGKADLELKDIDCFELNEAFAAQSLGVIKQLATQHGVDENWIKKRTNRNGGAIALGHPLGASGARILVTLLYELSRKKETLGVASLCVGGGMGTAVIIRRCGI